MKTLLGVAAALLLAWSGLALAQGMEDGQWEITMTTEMPGMPFTPPPMKYKTCVTKENMVPQQQQKNQDCKMLENKVSGNTVTWLMECTSKEGSTRSKGKITYADNGMDGSFLTTVKDGKETMEMKSTMKGKRLGPCTK